MPAFTLDITLAVSWTMLSEVKWYGDLQLRGPGGCLHAANLRREPMLLCKFRRTSGGYID